MRLLKRPVHPGRFLVPSLLFAACLSASLLLADDPFTERRSVLVTGEAAAALRAAVRVDGLPDGSLLVLTSGTQSGKRTAVVALVLKDNLVRQRYSVAGWLKQLGADVLGASMPGEDEGQVFFVSASADLGRAAASVGWWTTAGAARNGVVELRATGTGEFKAVRLVTSSAGVRDVRLLGDGFLALEYDRPAAKPASRRPRLVRYSWSGSVVTTYQPCPEPFDIHTSRIVAWPDGRFAVVSLSGSPLVVEPSPATSESPANRPLEISAMAEGERAVAAFPADGGRWIVALNSRSAGADTVLLCRSGSETAVSWRAGVPWNFIHATSEGRIQGVLFGPDGTRLESVRSRCLASATSVTK